MIPTLIIYVDVDDTLVRTAGTKRMPVFSTVRHVIKLKEEGATLYCWSSGGPDYAREIADELGIAECFAGFLPKPHVIIDDMKVQDWRYCLQTDPGACSSASSEEYRTRLFSLREEDQR